MASSINKLSILVRAHVDEFLDKKIDQHQPAVLEQYIEDLQTALDAYGDAISNQVSKIDGMRRADLLRNKEIAQLQASAVTFARAASVAGPNQAINNERGAKAMNQLKSLNAADTELDQQVLTEEATLSSMKSYEIKIQARLDEMRHQKAEIAEFEDESRAQDQTVKALRGARDAMDAVNTTSFDGLAEKAHARLDASSARLNRELAGMNQPASPEEDLNQAAAQLEAANDFEALKAQLAAGNAPAQIAAPAPA